MADLGGRRVLVLGASSGIGKAVVTELGRRGAHVAGAARRAHLVEARVPLACDVRDAAACAGTVDRAVEGLGGLDGVIYATGASPLKRLVEMTSQDWVDVLSTNVVGAALVTAAALPHLQATKGRAVYLSSNSVPTPLPGLGAYAASKAALEAQVRAWQAEVEEVDFVTYVVGPTLTGFADGWDPALAADLIATWEGVLPDSTLRPADEVAADIVDVFATGAHELR